MAKLLLILAVTRACLASPWGSKESADAEWSKEYDTPQHTSEPRRGYEARTYAPSTWACTNMTVDTAADPLAGLEGVPFTQLMQTKRYKKKVPSSKMFWKLFRYIGGLNEGNVEIEMTKGVTTSHELKEKDKWGEVELQEMCFYLENKFQESLGGVEAVPAPLDPAVYIKYRKEMTVYAKQFGGWAFTSATWQAARDQFAREIQRSDPYKEGRYYTGSKSHPWVPESERINEVWFEAVQ